MMKALILGLILVVAARCTDKPGAIQTLEAAGYSDIQTMGYSYFGCGSEDSHRDKFIATGPNGKRVEGVVCSGWFKGYTIRITNFVK